MAEEIDEDNPKVVLNPSADPGASIPPAEAVVPGPADIPRDVIETLGTYMMNKAERNYYYPTAPLEVNQDDGKETLGTPSVPNIADADSTDKGFMQTVTAVARSYYEKISDGSTPDAEGGGTLGPIEGILDKTSQTDGHNILSQIVGDEWEAIMSQNPMSSEETVPTAAAVREKVSAVLAHNRFQPGGSSPYIQDRDYSHGMFTLQKQLGRYNPSQEEEGVALDQLASIAIGTLLAAAGSRGESREDLTQDGAVVDGIGVQMGIERVETSQMRPAINMVINNDADADPSTSTDSLIDQDGFYRKSKKVTELENAAREADSVTSYGVLNTPLEQFGGPLPIGMIVLAVLAAVAMIVAAIVIGLLLTLIFLIPGVGPAAENAPPAPQPMGAAPGNKPHGKGGFGKWLMNFLSIPRLKSERSFFFCMLYGSLQFYFRILDVLSAGYFLVVTRAAIRDVEQIGDAMENANWASIVGALEGVMVTLEAFSTSTSWLFTMKMAQIGDIHLLSGGMNGMGEMRFAPYSSGANNPEKKPALISNLHLKSRTGPNGDSTDYRRALRFSSLPSKYLLPVNLLGASAILGEKKAFGAIASSIAKGQAVMDGNGLMRNKFGFDPLIQSGRFTTAQRQEIEESLDSYYFPFYFHDLRTNEVLALHTFVDSLTDSFTPQFNSMAGFGRMDDVQIYKSTKRTMGLSFYMVATGPHDQSELYMAINKLVSMVYPQWSRGTMKTDSEGNKFTIPFSQVPTASPVIRLRLGELWSSNYSLNNLARLFGAGTDRFKIKGGKVGDSASVESAYGHADIADESQAATKYQEVMERIVSRVSALDGDVDPTDALAANGAAQLGFPITVSSGYSTGMQVYVNPSTYRQVEFNAAFINYETRGPKHTINIPAYGPDSIRTGIIEGYVIQPVSAIVDADEEPGTQPQVVSDKVNYVRYAVSVPDPEGGNDVVICCNNTDISPDYDDLVDKATNDVFAEPLSPLEQAAIAAGGNAPPEVTFEVAEGIANFFKSASNSLVRSFEESGGQGIAGVITALDFDWNMAPWDERAGSRAPTYCKVTMGFQPIHDIPLGLDADGALRAPAYNVGNIVRGLFGTSLATEQIEAAAARAAEAARAAAAETETEGEPAETTPTAP